ncbi:phage tail assembly chaperone [Paracoccus sp. TK19116]|uniref:Phage tail assembly chaperone n=1 Tax=Paracoccus albicereus TaxID=2922394 RepID=A0ABT1MYD6_9RHOB|nr:phage tail assembly chaperone [Paracoccus albicereus]MCQ0971881.1 phage tail assembly chaperone [Paracoccus albicereus]
MSVGSDAKANGLDWPGLMRAGIRGLGLKPADFWALSPAELAMMLGVDAHPKMMTRDRLAELAAKYPDQR